MVRFFSEHNPPPRDDKPRRSRFYVKVVVMAEEPQEAAYKVVRAIRGRFPDAGATALEVEDDDGAPVWDSSHAGKPDPNDAGTWPAKDDTKEEAQRRFIAKLAADLDAHERAFGLEGRSDQ